MRTVLPGWILAVILGGALAGAMKYAYSQPIFKAAGEGAEITLTDEPCALGGAVSNLPHRATWVEKGKTFEGCWGARPDAGFIVTYFDDKTVAIIPMQAFIRVVGA